MRADQHDARIQNIERREITILEAARWAAEGVSISRGARVRGDVRTVEFAQLHPSRTFRARGKRRAHDRASEKERGNAEGAVARCRLRAIV